jgi:hypothetical protein
MDCVFQIQLKDNEFRYHNFESFEAACKYAETAYDFPDDGEWDQVKEYGHLYELESYLNEREINSHVVKQY